MAQTEAAKFANLLRFVHRANVVMNAILESLNIAIGMRSLLPNVPIIQSLKIRTFQKLPGFKRVFWKRAQIHPQLGPALRQLVDVIVAQPEAAVLSLFRVGKSRLVGVPVAIEARRVDPALEGRPWGAFGA